MTSLKIREFKQTISNFVQDTELPDEVKRMVLTELLKEQEEKTVLTLKKEIMERDIAGEETAENAKNI